MCPGNQRGRDYPKNRNPFKVSPETLSASFLAAFGDEDQLDGTRSPIARLDLDPSWIHA